LRENDILKQVINFATKASHKKVVCMKTNGIKSNLLNGNVLMITLFEWKCKDVGIGDANIYIDFLHSDSDEKATEIAVCWLPLGAAEHEGRIENLTYDDIIQIFGSYTSFNTECDQEKLISWIAKLSLENPSISSIN